MIVSIDYTESGAEIYGIIYNASDEVANGSGFVTYVTANREDYAIISPEEIAKHYVLTVPSYITPGTYSVTFYVQAGASPAETDNPVGAENFVVPTSSPAPTVPTDLILQLRILANDTETSNLITEETPKGSINSVNTKFRLQNQVIVSGSLYLTNGSTFRTQSGFTLDTANGILTMTVAPTSGTDPFVVDYNFNWFTDTDYASFLTEGAKALLSAATPDAVPAGLVPSLLHYGLYYFWLRRATQYAHRYSSSGGQAGQQVDVVTDNFRKLAKAAMDFAKSLRDDYYKGQGGALSPATAVTNVAFDPFTPRR